MLTALLLSLTAGGAVRGPVAPPAPPAEFLALEPAPPGAPPLLYCTPEGFGIVGQDFERAKHPIVEALRKAKAGSTVRLESGDYPPFTMGLGSETWDNVDIAGGDGGAPVVIDGRGRARIVGRQRDAIGIDQREPVRFITFRGLTIVPGRRAGVMFFKRRDGRDHVGFRFEDCRILGGFDHVRGTGQESRWGIWGHRLTSFRFVGTDAPAEVRGIRDGHAFELLNPQGNVLLDNVVANGLGGSFLYVRSALRDGPPGKGTLVLRRCNVSNVGLAASERYHNGVAFDVGGRHAGTLLFEDNTFRAGFDEDFKRLKPVGGVHGTGAMRVHQGEEGVGNGPLTLKDNDFRMAYGCGDRPLVSIGACAEVLLEGANHFASGGFHPVLALDPSDAEGRPSGTPNGSVHVAAETKLEGEVTRAGRPLDEADRAKLRASADEGEAGGSR